jgi:flavin-dependent dehydrogenase
VEEIFPEYSMDFPSSSAASHPSFPSNVRTIAIIGAGPAGTTAGILLKRAGYDVTIFHSGKRPPLIVGESLIPGVIPMLRELGLDEQVKQFGRFKPGATIYLDAQTEWSLPLSALGRPEEDFAYNVPRSDFDAMFLALAEKSGCRILRSIACVAAEEDSDRIALTDDTGEPVDADFILDASGRNRCIASTLKLPVQHGSREDVALFAHLDRAELPRGGNIHMNILPGNAWTWRIPLQDRVSVGIVAPKSYFGRFSDSVQKQYDAVCEQEPLLAPYIMGAERLTPVMKYSNYQLRSERVFGSNWAMIGDTIGFADPAFSSGVFLSLFSAFTFVREAVNSGFTRLERYQEIVQRELLAWQELIENFYDGSFFAMIRSGLRLRQTRPDVLERLDIDRIIATVISGFAYQEPGARESFRTILRMAAEPSSL